MDGIANTNMENNGLVDRNAAVYYMRCLAFSICDCLVHVRIVLTVAEVSVV